MIVLIYDVETTGFRLNGVPPNHPRQSRLVQLAARLLDGDHVAMRVSLVINPGVPVPEQASNIHRITTEIAQRIGVPEAMAVSVWDRMASKADRIVGHNLRFDDDQMELAFQRLENPAFDFQHRHGARERYCTMEASAPVVNIPATAKMAMAGRWHPKAPKLVEAYEHLFGHPLIDAHDAEVDTDACLDVYRHLTTMPNPILTAPPRRAG